MTVSSSDCDRLVVNCITMFRKFSSSFLSCLYLIICFTCCGDNGLACIRRRRVSIAIDLDRLTILRYSNPDRLFVGIRK